MKRLLAISMILAVGLWAPALASPAASNSSPSKPAAKSEPAPKPSAPKPSASKTSAPKAEPSGPSHDEHEEEHATETEAKPAASTSAHAAPTAPVTPTTPAQASENATVDADGAIKLLMEGNERWVNGKAVSPNSTTERRQQTADQGQKPFVTVLTCADSRLPVERLFDRGVGDVFVIRVAGNVAGDSEVGTIEYGVGHLKTPLLVVMGHTKCGAVGAAASNAEVHGKIAGLVEHISPAVDRARKANPNATPEQIAAIAVKENVWQTIFDLMKSSPELREEAAHGKVRVIGAICDITTDKVEWLGEHPWQSELISALNNVQSSQQTAGVETEHNEH